MLARMRYCFYSTSEVDIELMIVIAVWLYMEQTKTVVLKCKCLILYTTHYTFNLQWKLPMCTICRIIFALIVKYMIYSLWLRGGGGVESRGATKMRFIQIYHIQRKHWCFVILIPHKLLVYFRLWGTTYFVPFRLCNVKNIHSPDWTQRKYVAYPRVLPEFSPIPQRPYTTNPVYYNPLKRHHQSNDNTYSRLIFYSNYLTDIQV